MESFAGFEHGDERIETAGPGLWFRGLVKPVQDGVRVKLPKEMTWERLAAQSPDEIKGKNLWPAGFYPLPHPLC